MSDLKNILKKKYQAEVNPQFTEAAWKSFQQYKDLHKEEKRDRKGFIWFFLLSALVLFGTLSFAYLWQEETPNTHKQISSVTTLKKDQDLSETSIDLHSTQLETNENSNQQSNVNSPGKVNESSTSHNEYIDNVSHLKPKIFSSDSDDANPRSKISDINKAIKKQQPNVLFNKVDESIIDKDVTSSTEERLVIADLRLTPTNLSYVEYTGESLVNHNPIIPLERWKNQSRWTGMLAIGVGKMSHRSILNVRQNTVGTNFSYSIHNHWKIDGLFTFQKTQFTSRVQNRSLGIQSVPLPRSTMNLTEVKSRTTYFETGIGISYTFKPIDKIAVTVGPALRYIRELDRNLSYAFEDVENRMEQVFSSLENLNAHPYNLDLHSDLYYELSGRTSIGISASYIRSLGNSEVILPIQLRLSGGIKKRF